MTSASFWEAQAGVDALGRLVLRNQIYDRRRRDGSNGRLIGYPFPGTCSSHSVTHEGVLNILINPVRGSYWIWLSNTASVGFRLYLKTVNVLLKSGVSRSELSACVSDSPSHRQTASEEAELVGLTGKAVRAIARRYREGDWNGLVEKADEGRSLCWMPVRSKG